MNKSIVAITLAAVLAGLAHQAGADTPRQAGFHGLLGYRSIDIGDYHFTHDTHPDDAFMQGSQTPGSAGTTSLDNRLNLFALGIGYHAPIGRSVLFNFDVGGLFGDERNQIKNVNDDRADAHAAYVYSEARWGLFAAAGLSYFFNDKLYAGVEAQLAGINIDNGWYRVGEDESESTQLELYPSIGPKIGVAFSDRFKIEGSAQFGRGTGFTVNLVLGL